MKYKILFLSVDDWEVCYIDGIKFAEGHNIHSDDYIKLGMIMERKGYVADDVADFFLDEENFSDESILWDYPERVEDLHDEIKEYIKLK